MGSSLDPRLSHGETAWTRGYMGFLTSVFTSTSPLYLFFSFDWSFMTSEDPSVVTNKWEISRTIMKTALIVSIFSGIDLPEVRVVSRHGKTFIHHIANFCVTVLLKYLFNKIISINEHQMSKTNFQLGMKPLRALVKWTADDEILPVLAQFLWTLNFIFSTFYGKLFLPLLQATIEALLG